MGCSSCSENKYHCQSLENVMFTTCKLQFKGIKSESAKNLSEKNRVITQIRLRDLLEFKKFIFSLKAYGIPIRGFICASSLKSGVKLMCSTHFYTIIEIKSDASITYVILEKFNDGKEGKIKVTLLKYCDINFCKNFFCKLKLLENGNYLEEYESRGNITEKTSFCIIDKEKYFDNIAKKFNIDDIETFSYLKHNCYSFSSKFEEY